MTSQAGLLTVAAAAAAAAVAAGGSVAAPSARGTVPGADRASAVSVLRTDWDLLYESRRKTGYELRRPTDTEQLQVGRLVCGWRGG